MARSLLVPALITMICKSRCRHAARRRIRRILLCSPGGLKIICLLRVIICPDEQACDLPALTGNLLPAGWVRGFTCSLVLARAVWLQHRYSVNILPALFWDCRHRSMRRWKLLLIPDGSAPARSGVDLGHQCIHLQNEPAQDRGKFLPSRLQLEFCFIEIKGAADFNLQGGNPVTRAAIMLGDIAAGKGVFSRTSSPSRDRKVTASLTISCMAAVP